MFFAYFSNNCLLNPVTFFMRKQRSFFILTLLFLAGFSFGQQAKLDSLESLLREKTGPRDLADIHIQLAFIYYDFDSEAGFKEANEALQIAREGKYVKGIKFALTLVGYKYFEAGDYSKAFEYFHQSEIIDPEAAPEASGYNWVMMGNAYRIQSYYDSAEYFLNKGIAILERAKERRFLAYGYKNLGLVKQNRYELNEAEDLFEKSLQIRNETGEKRGIIDCHLVLGTLELSRSNYLKAKEYFDEACKMTEGEFRNNLALKVQCYFNSGVVNYRLGNFEIALNQLFQAKTLLENQDYVHLYAQVNQRIGDVYSELDQAELALKYLFEALSSYEKIKARKEIGMVLSEIGWVYKSQLNFNLALQFLNRSQKIRESIDDQQGLSNCFNIRGLIFFQQKNDADALLEMNRALVIRKQIGYREGVADVLFNMALVFEQQGNLKKALAYQTESMEMEKEFGSDLGMGISYNYLGELLIRMGEFKEAKKYLTEGEKRASRTGSKLLLRDNYKYLSALYEKTGDYKKAIELRKLYDQIKDSVYSQTNSSKMAEMHALYQIDQKNQELQLKETQLKLQEDQIREQNTIIISVTIGIILTSLLTYISFRYFRNIRKANKAIVEQKEEIQAQSEELIEANETIGRINLGLEAKVNERTSELKQAYKELDTFFYRSSHDFRRPLTTFLGLAEVAKVTVKDPNALELFDKVRETALNLDKMLFKLQSISDLGAQQLVYKEVFVNELVNEILDNFEELIARNKVMINLNIEVNASFFSYPAMVRIIIENLLENAIFFCRSEGSMVSLKINFYQKELTIEVHDNGQGIAEEYQARIFDMYYRANQNSKGNGLGLYIVKKSVEKLHGRIRFNSIAGEGSTFTITLPSAESMMTS
jgi:signal transduction histidine kinase